MMNYKTLIVFLFLGLSACEGEIIGLNENEVRVVAEVAGADPDAPYPTWLRDDVIGIYTKKAGQLLSDAALTHNFPYVSDGSTAFNSVSTPLTWPEDEAIDFIGYFPYREGVEGYNIPIDLTDQSQQGSIGLMYSDNEKACNAETRQVELLFSHQLSKILLHVTPPQGMSVDGMTVALSGAGTKASFDLSTGELNAYPEVGDILLNGIDGTRWVEGTILPTNDVSGMSIWFFLPGMHHAYRYPLGESLQTTVFEKSTRYTFHVTLVDEHTLVLNQGSIAGWKEAPLVYGVAVPNEKEPPFPMPGNGSFEFPFTVEQARQQKNLGKETVWVEGYIVGSVDGTMNKFIPGDDTVVTSNIAIADAQNETDKGKVMPVNLTEGTSRMRDALNLWSHPWNLNRKIKIQGDIETYFLVPGLRKPKDYAFRP